MRISVFYSYLFILIFSVSLSGQPHPDFTITDSDNVTHKLYEDYLDKGYTVVIKIFFVDCPPCNSIAPFVQTLYEDWGEGQYDVQFIELSNKSNDTNADVAGYKAQHGITFPGAGIDGGALVALGPLLSGIYGPAFGTPKFAVISPDGTVNFSINGPGNQGKIDALDAAIAATGATGDGGGNNVASVFNFNVTDLYNNPVDEFELVLTSDDNPGLQYPISLTSGFQLSITDLNETYPGLTNPKIVIRKTDEVKDKISAIDLLIIIRHILNVEPIDNSFKELAADSNGDGIINAIDLLTLQRIILGIIDEFPNSDSYIFLPAELPLNLLPGEVQDLNFMAIKIGDLNGF